MEHVETEQPGAWRLEMGFDWETGRTLSTSGGNDLDYDNIRFHPLDLRYGYNEWIEFGGGLGYSLNSEDNQFGTADEGGFEGLSFFGKARWNKYVATSLELGFLGNDEVFPYSADGFNIGINVPGQISLGPGRVTGELGFTVQTGDAKVISNSSSIVSDRDRESYFNYALGYVYDVNRSFSLTTELRGNGETIEDGESMFEYIIGIPIRWSRASTFEPSFSAGISDGSPDFAFGFDWNYSFGKGERYVKSEDESSREDRLSSEANQSEDPLVLPEEERRASRNRNKNRQSSSSSQSQSDLQARKSQSDLSGVSNQSNRNDTQRITPSSSKKRQQRSRQTRSRTNPEKAAQLARRARKSFEQNNYRNAINLYKKAANLDPGNVEYQSNLGSLYYRQDNYRKAQTHYQKALEIDPRDYFSHLYLGATLYRMGNSSKARRHFRRVLQIKPDNRQAQRWLDRLDQDRQTS